MVMWIEWELGCHPTDVPVPEKVAGTKEAKMEKPHLEDP
jgi:hypothetical protein